MARRQPRAPKVWPTTPWALFLLRERLAAGKTADEVFADVREAMSWGEESRSAYLNLEHGPMKGGREPNPDEQSVLSAYYGGRRPEPVVVDEPTSERDELIAALASQTEAINRLVDKLDSLASDAIRSGVMDALREAGLAQGGGAS